mmetsp:Transcript_7176/g.14986  ORF Transcript_7176/g.14986 Transcript_7176/m.14986 type:complete len:213 (+) Transcript_7176:75-713(+)
MICFQHGSKSQPIGTSIRRTPHFHHYSLTRRCLEGHGFREWMRKGFPCLLDRVDIDGEDTAGFIETFTTCQCFSTFANVIQITAHEMGGGVANQQRTTTHCQVVSKELSRTTTQSSDLVCQFPAPILFSWGQLGHIYGPSIECFTVGVGATSSGCREESSCIGHGNLGTTQSILGGHIERASVKVVLKGSSQSPLVKSLILRSFKDKPPIIA